MYATLAVGLMEQLESTPSLLICVRLSVRAWLSLGGIPTTSWPSVRSEASKSPLCPVVAVDTVDFTENAVPAASVWTGAIVPLD